MNPNKKPLKQIKIFLEDWKKVALLKIERAETFPETFHFILKEAGLIEEN